MAYGLLHCGVRTARSEVATLQNDIKSPFTFEFLGLSAKNVVEESDLESAILNHLQDFILELGMGLWTTIL